MLKRPSIIAPMGKGSRVRFGFVDSLDPFGRLGDGMVVEVESDFVAVNDRSAFELAEPQLVEVLASVVFGHENEGH